MDNLNPKSGVSPEADDLSVGGIIKAAVILVSLGILTFVAAQGLMRGFEFLEVQSDKPLSMSEQHQRSLGTAGEKKATADAMQKEDLQPTDAEKKRIAEEMHVRSFPNPRLQYDEVSEMKAMLTGEHGRLDSSGKDGQGNIHISIDQAIDILSKRGLPPVTGTFTPVDTTPTSVFGPVILDHPPAKSGAGVKQP
ncbi:MAG TPA: hypothetical protein VNW97_14750 [Candidatus Saccharimonadales bacterium]|jgi:hypothetical protein|nr:hypothetical protein [Candidatus Saccharimonadales bacterium]